MLQFNSTLGTKILSKYYDQFHRINDLTQIIILYKTKH